MIDDVMLRTPLSLGPVRLALLSAVIGAVAGIGAAAFRVLIALIHNLFFLGAWSPRYDVVVHTPVSPWGAGIVLAPVLGALVVAFLVKTFAPEAKGHGVPEVMDAIYYGKGVIRPVVVLVKSLASALSIGSGGSVGREGPIIQIGSAFGSSLGQWLAVPPWQRITMIAAGAAGGLAATFNTPIGGVLFASELLLHEVSVRTIVPVAIATAAASWVGQLIFGASPSFVIPVFEQPYFHITSPGALGAYAGLGTLMGLASLLFIRALYGFEDFFEQRVPGGYPVQHASGMLLVGLLFYGMMRYSGHYYVEGVGYAAIQDVLTGALAALPFLLLLFGLKLLATSLTLGSGASGGIFSPALFLGATLGAAYGALIQALFPSLHLSPAAFAVAGMAGIVAGSTGALITSIVMIFEMTRDYGVVIPMTVTVALSYGLRKLLCADSIYAVKLTRRGHHVPDALHAALHLARRAKEAAAPRPQSIPAAAKISERAAQLRAAGSPEQYLVEENGRLLGVLHREDALQALSGADADATAGALAVRNYAVAAEDATLFDALAALRGRPKGVVLLASGARAIAAADVTGVISRDSLADALIETADFFAD